VRPPEARLKPKVSAFINAKFDKIRRSGLILVLASPTCRPISRPSSSAAA
jgi:hypothetical protein